MTKSLGALPLMAVPLLLASCASEPLPVIIYDLEGEWIWPTTRIETQAGACVIPEHRILFELHPSSTGRSHSYTAIIRDTNIQCSLPAFPTYRLTMGGYRGTGERNASGSIRDNTLQSISLDVGYLLLGSRRVGTMFLWGQELRFIGEDRIEGRLGAGVALTPFQEVGYDLEGKFQLIRPRSHPPGRSPIP